MNMFIQNCFLSSVAVADKVDKVAVKSAEAVTKTGKALTTWDQLVLYWHKVELFYTDHQTLINVLVTVVVIGLLYRLVCFRNKKYAQSFLDNIANQLASWLAPQTNYATEELKQEFLLLLQGKESDLLSKTVLGLQSEFTELGQGRLNHNIQFIYQKGNDVLKTTLSNQMEWEDLPSAVRKKFLKTNSQTVVIDYLKQVQGE